ncbi:MAG: hypothetical protein UV20_C0009G0009 [Candidatus Magasanikbacteria bacterium GW2011_GWA2_42_32]|uniref:Uncharacterized protein n=1 Tax=Candidatus Magasanikbacteria bacterium GW2011_GWA2_42_32 TaxID=1619039 RepID=A0A0G1A682_9BACT|nr:MAG: hypothetical protein UV20_C0009G0009 [Candidatus Magasanikbacteria bacterium GW2011_GWA2_42_32]HBX15917.1 hypothetical protein [Candidatus Magasanikbacteria bacterium]
MSNNMSNLFEFLSGKKTYILAAVGFVWALIGWIMGFIDAKQAQEVIWASLTAMALRAGINKN